MLDSLLHYLRTTHDAWAYVVLGGAAAVEFVFPPFPGDTVTLFGVFLAVVAGYDPLLVYVTLVGGSVAGSLVAWGFGLSLPRDERHGPRFLRGPRAQRALGAIRHRFDDGARLFLVLNRFVPALRGLVFVGAGIARIGLRDVLVFGGLGAMIWNAVLFLAGYLVGDHWGRLSAGVARYSLVALGVAVCVLMAGWILGRRHTRR